MRGARLTGFAFGRKKERGPGGNLNGAANPSELGGRLGRSGILPLRCLVANPLGGRHPKVFRASRRGLSEKRENRQIQALAAPLANLVGSALRRGLYRIIEYGPRERKQSPRLPGKRASCA